MELAALLAAGLQDWVDFGVICGRRGCTSGARCIRPCPRTRSWRRWTFAAQRRWTRVGAQHRRWAPSCRIRECCFSYVLLYPVTLGTEKAFPRRLDDEVECQVECAVQMGNCKQGLLCEENVMGAGEALVK